VIVTVANPVSGAIAVPTSPVIVVVPVFVIPVLARTAKGAAAPSDTVVVALEKSRPNPAKGNTNTKATAASITVLFGTKIYITTLAYSLVSVVFTPCEA
jgi:hypothetical protein